MERRTLPALVTRFATLATALVTALLTVQISTAPAALAAPVDPELVVESINDGGLYVDSSAVRFKTDAAKDRLRAQLETAKRPVYVAVVPAGTSLTPTGLYQIVQKRGTYAVLNGDSLKASSNVLPSSQVRTAVTGAIRTNPRNPEGAVVSFVHLTNGTPKSTPVDTGTAPRPGLSTAAAAPDESVAAAPATPASAASPTKDDSTMLLIIGGLVAIILAAATALLLLWRSSRRKNPGIGR
jgi:hypothetical protein